MQPGSSLCDDWEQQAQSVTGDTHTHKHTHTHTDRQTKRERDGVLGVAADKAIKHTMRERERGSRKCIRHSKDAEATDGGGGGAANASGGTAATTTRSRSNSSRKISTTDENGQLNRYLEKENPAGRTKLTRTPTTWITGEQNHREIQSNPEKWQHNTK